MMRTRDHRWIFLISLLLFLFLPLPCLQATIIISGTLTHEYVVAAGQNHEGMIEVSNPDDTPQEVKAYQTDYFFSSDGSTSYGAPGSLERSNAFWISLSPKTIMIPAKETVSIYFTIQVPANAPIKGTYWSIIMVEPIPAGSIESSSSMKNDINVGVNQTLRYAVQIVTHIKDTGTLSLKFNQIKLVAEKGKRYLLIDIVDTGERWLKAAAWADIYDSKGKLVGKFEGGKKRIYPGTSVRFSVELGNMPPAAYKALIVIDCGENDVFGTNVNFLVKE